MTFVVDERGVPTQIRVLRPIGYGLDERAIESIKSWRFEPGLKDGKPLNVAANIEVNFRLMGGNIAALEERWTEYKHALALLKGDSQEKVSALKTLQVMVQANFAPAMYSYGQLLAEGKDVPPDLESRAISLAEPRKPNMGQPCSHSPPHVLNRKTTLRVARGVSR